jgi:hypothetical protein
LIAVNESSDVISDRLGLNDRKNEGLGSLPNGKPSSGAIP